MKMNMEAKENDSIFQSPKISIKCHK